MSTNTRIGATLGASLMLALSACSDAQADSWTGRDKQMRSVDDSYALCGLHVQPDLLAGPTLDAAHGRFQENFDALVPEHLQ